jgi:threonine dehydrogenase-like Zn-dependent dehydrogenase
VEISGELDSAAEQHSCPGSSAAHIAPAAVAGKVIVADIDAQKRAYARQTGAIATIDNGAPDAVKNVMEATGGGAAAPTDFVGSPKMMEAASASCAKASLSWSGSMGAPTQSRSSFSRLR